MTSYPAPEIYLPGGVFEPVINAVLIGGPDFICVHGGRGSSKTMTIAGAIALRSSMTATRTAAMRERQNSIRESSRAVFVKVIKRMRLRGWKLGQYELTHTTGSKITFHGLHSGTVDSMRSIPDLDIAWGDEAQKFSYYSIQTLLPTIREDNTQVIFTMNPTDPEQVVYKDYVTNPVYPDQTLIVQANYDSNPFFPKRLDRQRKADEKRKPEEARHVWHGEPAILSASQVFKRGLHWEVDACDGFGAFDEVPESVIPCFGLDIGQGNHPSIILRVYYWEDRIHIAAESVDMSLTNDNLEEFVEKAGVDRGDVVWSDRQALPWKRAPKGWSLKHVPKQAGGEDRGVKFIKGKFLTIHPDCKMTIKQWPRYSFKVNAEEVVLPEYDDHDDDAPDCVRYALHELIYGLDNNDATGAGGAIVF